MGLWKNNAVAVSFIFINNINFNIMNVGIDNMTY